MAIKVVHLQNAGANALEVRRMIAALTADAEGVVGSGDLAVSEKSGTPDMSVDVAIGRWFVKGTETTFQGTYFLENDAVKNITIAAADASNPRKDLIVALIEDAADGAGPGNLGDIQVVTGTPAASPVEPTAPPNSLELAMVDVPALDTSIENAQITDRRVRYDDWKAWTPTLDQGGSVTFSTNTGITHYSKIGRTIIARIGITATAVGTASNSIIIGGLPAAVDVNAFGGSFWYNDPGGSPVNMTGIVFGSSTTEVKLLQDAAASSLGVAGPTIAIGDTIYATIIYEAA